MQFLHSVFTLCDSIFGYALHDDNHQLETNWKIAILIAKG